MSTIGKKIFKMIKEEVAAATTSAATDVDKINTAKQDILHAARGIFGANYKELRFGNDSRGSVILHNPTFVQLSAFEKELSKVGYMDGILGQQDGSIRVQIRLK